MGLFWNGICSPFKCTIPLMPWLCKYYQEIFGTAGQNSI